jgi:MYXO-CTERM domain-containing protein
MFGIGEPSPLARSTQQRCVRSEPVRARRSMTLVWQLSMFLGSLVAACATDGPTADPSSGMSRGTVAVYMARFDEGGSGKQYFLRSDKNETRLYFETDPDLSPGTAIRVSGQPLNDGLRVLHYEVEPEPVGAAVQPLINGMVYKPRTFAFVLVDIGSGINLSMTDAQKRMFGTNPGDKSVKQYYDEVSYGTQDITGDILGPFSYPMTTCDTRGVATALKTKLGTYDHYLWYFGSRNTACQFSGLAEAGKPSKPTNDVWFNGSANCVVLVQEPGHNFGMMHSSSMTCGTASFADDPDSACTHSEYGDRYDPMGGACNHMNAWQKVFEGWLQKCNGVTTNSSGMYTLQPLELTCDGAQVLQIPMPKVRPFGRSGGGGLPTTENLGFYYLELRTPRGFDDTIRTSPTILVHVAEDLRERTDRGRHTWILDMDPSTRTIDGLGAGKSFTDPAGGVSFQVMAISADSATIQVTVPNDAALPRMCGALAGPPGTASDAGVPVAGGSATVPPPRVEAFILVDADTGKDIRTVEENAVLDLSQLPPNLTLRVDTDPPVVGSVKFRIDAGAPRVDNMAPYAISNNATSGKLAPWMLAVGAHTVNATPYDAADGGGRQGEPFQIDLMLTRSGVGAPGAGASGGSPAGGSGAAGTPVTLMNAAAGSGNATAGAGAGTSALPPTASRNPPPPSGCSCRVAGAGTGSVETSRMWALAALALGLFMRRRRLRRARRARDVEGLDVPACPTRAH